MADQHARANTAAGTALGFIILRLILDSQCYWNGSFIPGGKPMPAVKPLIFS